MKNWKTTPSTSQLKFPKNLISSNFEKKPSKKFKHIVVQFGQTTTFTIPELPFLNKFVLLLLISLFNFKNSKIQIN